VVLVLEEVAPGAPLTVRTTDQTPSEAAPGVDLANAGSGANRLIERVPPASLDTVLVKEQVTPRPSTQSMKQ
jgi:hypothetical protein